MKPGTQQGTTLACIACAVVATAMAMAMVLIQGSTKPARAEEAAKADPVLDRAREQVKMLDDLYKTTVVTVTQIYDGPPAIKVAKQAFAAMDKKGWHSARLVDVTGNPLNEANVPATDFEKRAADAIRAGKTYFEDVRGEGEKRRLYAATVVPAVMKKCATCHGVKEGDLLGFIRYDLPVK